MKKLAGAAAAFSLLSGVAQGQTPSVQVYLGGASKPVATGPTGTGIFIPQTKATGLLDSSIVPPIAATTAARSTSQPTNPSATASTSQVAMGLAGSLTPTVSGNIFVTMVGDGFNSVSTDGGSLTAIFGTGAAPANGATVTGFSVCGSTIVFIGTASTAKEAWALNCYIPARTVGTPEWIDIAAGAAIGGSLSLENINIVAIEE